MFSSDASYNANQLLQKKVQKNDFLMIFCGEIKCYGFLRLDRVFNNVGVDINKFFQITDP